MLPKTVSSLKCAHFSAHEIEVSCCGKCWPDKKASLFKLQKCQVTNKGEVHKTNKQEQFTANPELHTHMFHIKSQHCI